jgi:predicted nucleic acid-binding protein
MTYSNTEKRKLLTSALFQHSSKVQTFKQTALERITERIIYFSGNKGLKVNEIQSIFREELKYNLPTTSFIKALDYLLENERVEKEVDEKTFKLSKETFDEFKLIEANTDKSYTKLTNKLFHTPPDNKENYIEPFWVSMDYIFSSVGEFSAKLVDGTLDKETVLNPILKNCMNEVKAHYKINHDYFFKQLKLFFENTNEPLYNEFRWVLAQNYFITSSLGINPESEPFSKELFKDTTLYLDTNVILSLISTRNKHFNNVSSLIEAANKLEMNYCLCQVTIEEYERWVNSELEDITRAIDQIPKKTKSKIGSCIYQDLQFELSKIGEVTKEERQELLDKIIGEYLDVKTVIEKFIPEGNITYIDNTWFDSIENDKLYEETITTVKTKFLDLRGRKKGNNASAHDAKILLWIDKEITESKSSNWFVTSDYSLPLIKINGQEKSTSIILEAILQWLVPLTSNGDFQEKFSQTLKQKILPQEFLFETSDFVIFEELHMECNELPSEDVEDCILFLKKNAPNLNPNLPEDREKLAAHIAKHFYDPGRKYKKELSEKEKENETLTSKLGDVMKAIDELRDKSDLKETELKDTKELHSTEIGKIKEEHEKKVEIFEGSFQEIHDELSGIKEEKRQEKIDLKFNKWQKPAKFSFALFILLTLFGVLEFIPDWGWNYPAKIINEINQVENTNKALYNTFLGLNIFLITGLIISLFLFSYKRLFNSDNIEEKKEKLNEKIK